MEVKGQEHLDAFVDQGPAFDPSEGPGGPFFQAIVEQSAELVLAFGHDGTIHYANDACRVLLGHEPTALLGTNALSLVAPEDLENAARTIYHAAEVVGWRPPRPFRLLHADGRRITFEVAGLSLFDDDRVRSIVCVGRWADTASRVDRVIGLLAAQRPTDEVLAELVHLLDRPGWQLGVALQHDDGRGGTVAAASPAAADLTGVDHLGEGPWSVAKEEGRPVVDVGLETVPAELRTRAEEARFVTCWAVPVPDPIGRPACLVVWNAEPLEPELGQDLVLQRLLSLVELALAGRARAIELDRAAHCDPLTGLWNRRYLEQSAADAVGRPEGGHVALVLCDLDGFKAVNDGFGHPAGDAVVQAVGGRLRDLVRASDVVARLGGDEFAVLCPGVASPDDVARVAARIVADVCRPITFDGATLRVGVSVGVAVAEAGAPWDLDRLVRVADAHLLDAKAGGKATYRIGALAPSAADAGV